MPHSIIIDGKVEDLRFVRQPNLSRTLVYVGDLLIGQLWKIGNAWDAVGQTPSKCYPASGFRTRIRAAEFLIQEQQIGDYWKS